MSVSIDLLPAAAARASRELVEGLDAIFGPDLVAAWLHGGTTFPDRPGVPGDLDIFVVVARGTPAERDLTVWPHDRGSRPRRAYAVQEAVSRIRDVAIDLNFVLKADAAASEPPGEAFVVERRVVTWPIQRAHWLAGQYVLLHGQQPETLVVPPTPAELVRALDRELEHLERHVYEGDAADPGEATYAMFNGCRILYTLETGSPVVSKRSAGAWALENLSERWHPAIRSAGRTYDGMADDGDRELLRVTMSPFVEMVRARLPLTEARPPGPPRWST